MMCVHDVCLNKKVNCSIGLKDVCVCVSNAKDGPASNLSSLPRVSNTD